MNSNIPTRRVTRATRTTVLRDKENATARAVGRTTRAKPSSSSVAPVDVKPSGIARATASTAATRAKTVRVDPAAQGKRKREALGEVAKPSENKARLVNTGPIPLKENERVKEIKQKFEGVILKKTTTMTTTVRKPLRTVAGTAATTTTATTTTAAATTTRRTRSTTAAVQLQQPHPPPQPEPEPSRTQRHRRLEAVKEEPAPDNLMSVDLRPPVAPVPSPRRFVAAREAAASRHSADHPRIPRRAHTRNVARYEEVDAEAERAFKKRRTSSDAPDVEALHEAEVENAVIPSEEIEADPNGDEWDDLDADDADDPLMVSEYVTDIFEYLKEVEQTTMPNPNYMDNQKDLTWKMRGILNDWLIQVHSRFRLLPETLFLCINLVDRFLSARVVSLVKLQLVGITCLFIAAKVEEIVAPSASNFIYCAEASYDENDILQAERYVLKTIGWNVNYPNPMHFLRRISKADDYNVQVRTVAKFLLELQCVEWRLVAAPPSLLAAAAVWLARIILGFPDWTPNLAHYSSYPESALVPTANLMLNYLLKPVQHPCFEKKYAARKFFKASVFVREWAVEHWGNVRHVSLPDELPALKALIREALAREEALAQQDLADVGEYFEQ